VKFNYIFYHDIFTSLNIHTHTHTHTNTPQGPEAHACNPSYTGGRRDQEDGGSKLAQANSSQDPISKTLNKHRAGGVAQAVQCLPSKLEPLNSNPSTAKKKFF
jgi:hypothetical protein